MNLIFRLLYLTFFSARRSAVSIMGPCVTPFRCWFTDLDVLRHMNNGKYFSIMDLARVDLMIRAGLWKKLAQKGWYPVVVAETMKFKKSLGPLQKFNIVTRVIGWDEKAFLLTESFMVGDQVYAEAVIRARFLKKSGGSVTPSELLELAGEKGPSPELPEWIRAWNQAQQ